VRDQTREAAPDVLVLSGLAVRLGGRAVLDGVDLRVGAGEFVGLIGSNGAGKTTLLRAILGLQAPTSGRVTVGAGRRRESIGYVPQKVHLDPDVPLRARDVVALGLDGNRLGIPLPSAVKAGRVDEMLAAVGAESFADARIGRLSGGQQQRVLLAHALISNPRLLLLDEPLANLDPASVHEIVALLARLSSERGVAVVLSAHDMNPLLAHMTRMVYLADGRAAVGSVDDVVRDDVLTRLYGRGIRVVRAEGHVFVVATDDVSGRAA
jgi:zinc/manganese transport system ATP-binding protein